MADCDRQIYAGLHDCEIALDVAMAAITVMVPSTGKCGYGGFREGKLLTIAVGSHRRKPAIEEANDLQRLE